MRSKLAVAAVLAAVLSGAIALSAAERGTFILRNGQRESGVLSAHTESRSNLINGFFNLGDMPGGTGNLRERAYPQDQVAVIDFAGGQISPEELSQLNRMNDQPHLLVMRGGRSVPGRFDNIVGGDTVVFANQQYAVRDVARVYLDVEAARTIFNVQPASSARNRNDRGSAEQGRGSEIRVSARRPWTDTGIAVRRGQRVFFRASGEIGFTNNNDSVCGPDGHRGFRGSRRDFPVPEMMVGALVGRVGDGQPFGIGLQTQALVMPDDGVLYLGVNDANYEDNRGAFLVEVSVRGR